MAICCACLPCWVAEIPRYQTKEDEESSLGWRQTTVFKKFHNSNRGEVKTYLEEKATGNLTAKDTLSTITNKCAMIAIGVFFYAAAAMAFNVIITLPSSLVNLCLLMIREIGEQFKKGTPLDSLLVIGKVVLWQLPKTLLYIIWTVVRAPIFAVGVMFAAICGLFSPMQGRKWVAAVEHEWHDRVSHKMDLRYEGVPHKNDHEKAMDDLMGIVGGKFFFLAYCFQTLGNVNDPRITRIEP